MTAVVGLTVAADADAWRRIGLRVDDATAWVGGVAIEFVAPAAGRSGIVGWTLLGSPQQPDEIDGLATRHTVDAATRAVPHPIGATAFDHVVVMTSSLERTCAAMESTTGEPLKRVRETGEVRQGFHRLGPVIVEVVESARVTSAAASFWGLVLIVDDIHEAAGRLGPEMISLPKTAVQPGRFIASFRQDAGLGLPVALMSR